MTKRKKGDDGGDYEVGYGRPPVESRFSPGHSGNKLGRPKARKSIREKFDKELKSKLTIRENGREFKVSKFDLWVRRVIAEAIKGDYRMSTILMKAMGASADELVRNLAEQSISDLTDEDRDILARHLSLARAPAASQTEESSWSEEDDSP